MLTTLARAKAFYDIGDDTLYTTLLDTSSGTIKRYCGRDFEAADYTEIHAGREILLKQFPVLRLMSVGIGNDTAFGIQNTSTDATDASVWIDETSIRLIVSGGTNADDTTLTLASYTDIETLTAAITALNKGWSIEEVSGFNDRSPLDLWPQGAYGCLRYSVNVRAVYEKATTFDLDRASGFLTLPSSYDCIIKYRAGYETIPDDLQQICIDLAKSYFESKSTSSGIQSEKIGDYAYTLSGDNLLPRTIQLRLNQWRRYA